MSTPSNESPYRLFDDVEFGEQVHVGAFTNLYGCRVGDRTRIGPFVEIQGGVQVGADCKIQSRTFVCEGVTICDRVVVGHGVVFINDKLPRATNERGGLQEASDWELQKTLVEEGSSIGSAAVILGGVRIGADALVGAGAVVTSDVAAGEVVAGVPARVLQRTASPKV
jgi:acetyltransferase-like isoleucine patch superfamily enzyme